MRLKSHRRSDSVAGSQVETGDCDEAGSSRHFVQFYDKDEFLVEAVARFVGSGIGAGEAVVVIATEDHRRRIESELQSRGLALSVARDGGKFIELDAAETLEQFMIDGEPDEKLFRQVVGTVLKGAADHAPRVHAFGEMVAVLWARGEREAAVRLEQLWNNLARDLSFSLLCAYPLAGFDRDGDADDFRRVCGEHNEVLPAESYNTLAEPNAQLRTVAELQQRARALEQVLAERHSIQSILAERDEMLRALVIASPSAIVVADTDNTVRLWNPAAERLFGWTADEVMGRPIPIVPGEKLDERAGLRQDIDEGKSLRGVETYRLRRDGTTVPVALSAAPLGGEGAVRSVVLIFEDLSSRQPAEEARQRLAAIVESSDDAIIGKDLNGIVTNWNRGAEKIFGYTADEMVGQSILRIVPPDRSGDVAQILSTIERGERVEHFESERVRKDGQRIFVSLSVSPIRDAAGRIVGASKIARDVSDRKREESAKDQFLAMLGHELRNPLSAVRNAVTTAALDPTASGRALEIARHGTDQLTRLVDDLLDVTRITRGSMTLRKESVAFGDIVQRAIDSVHAMFQEHSVALTVSLPPRNLHIEADSARIEQVVGNLLSNAAKYTEPGGRVTVTLDHIDGFAELRVRDTGIGIDADLLPRVFDLFVQAEQAVDRTRGGLGLGLTLVKQLIEMHGGHVTAKSDGLGCGAEFSVRLPAVVRPPKDASASPIRQVRAGLDRRVLIVEDNADAAESMTMLLELLGLRVRAVGDGISALEMARANPPDVMLIDIGLPGMNGYELAEHIRREEKLAGITLVALTGYGQEEDRQKALAAGFDYHLVKPVDFDKVESLVAGIPPSKTLLH